MSYTQLKTPNTNPSAIYSGNTKLTNWAGWCLAYVQVAFGTPRLYPTAWAAWQATTKKHTNRSFPRNVYFPVWFSHFATYNGVHQNWGHVAVARVDSNGSIALWSSPASNKAAPDTFTSIEAVERMFSSKYVGWSEDLSNTQLIKKKEVEMTKEDAFKECFITLAARWPTKAELDAWKKSGMTSYTWVQQNAPVGYRVDRDKARAERDKVRADFAAYQERVEAEMSQLSKDIISHKVDMEAAQAAQQRAEAELRHSNSINAELRASVEQRAQELASQAATDYEEQLFKVAFLTQTGEHPPAKTIETWKRTDMAADEWVRANVRNDSIHELQLLLDHANKSVGSLTEDINNHTKNIAELATRLDGIAVQADEDRMARLEAETALQVERQANEELRSKLSMANQMAQPVEEWSLLQLVVEVIKRAVKLKFNKTKQEGGSDEGL